MADDPSQHPDTEQRRPPRPWWDRWRLGMLTVLAIVVVGGGVLLFGDGDSAETPPDQPGLSLPPLPAPERGEESAPDFAVDLFDGSRFILGEHLRDDGRPIILNLWASWCFPCREEMPDLDEAAAEHPEVLVLGIAVDDEPRAARDFAAEIAVAYPLGADRDGRVGRAYPAPGLPATYVIGSDGSIREVVFGRLTADQIGELVALATG